MIYLTTDSITYSGNSPFINLNNDIDTFVSLDINGLEQIENENFKKALDIVKPQQWMQEEMVKGLFRQLSETPEYAVYISEESREKLKEKEILKDRKSVV